MGCYNYQCATHTRYCVGIMPARQSPGQAKNGLGGSQLSHAVPWFLARSATNPRTLQPLPTPTPGVQGFQEWSVTRLEPTWTVRPPARPSDSIPMSGYNAVPGSWGTDIGIPREPQVKAHIHTISTTIITALPSRRSFDVFVYYPLHRHG